MSFSPAVESPWRKKPWLRCRENFVFASEYEALQGNKIIGSTPATVRAAMEYDRQLEKSWSEDPTLVLAAVEFDRQLEKSTSEDQFQHLSWYLRQEPRVKGTLELKYGDDYGPRQFDMVPNNPVGDGDPYPGNGIPSDDIDAAIGVGRDTD